MPLDLNSTVPQWETTQPQDQEDHYQENVVRPELEREEKESFERSMEYGD